MISLTQIRYGSCVRRQGKSRACRAYHVLSLRLNVCRHGVDKKDCISANLTHKTVVDRENFLSGLLTQRPYFTRFLTLYLWMPLFLTLPANLHIPPSIPLEKIPNSLIMVGSTKNLHG